MTKAKGGGCRYIEIIIKNYNTLSLHLYWTLIDLVCLVFMNYLLRSGLDNISHAS